MRVLRAIAHALNMSVEASGGARRPAARTASSVEEAIAADPHLTDEQRAALLAVYRSYVEDTKRSR